MRTLTTLIVTLVLMMPSAVQAQLWASGLKFGYDYGRPVTVENLNFIATHHDYVMGVGDFNDKRVTEFQYDTMRAANPDVIIFVYTPFQAFTFEPMLNFFDQYALDNSIDQEEKFLHYYYDQVVLMRTPQVRTTGTGTVLDRVCDADGVLVDVGATGWYYQQWGYDDDTDLTDGSSAPDLESARAFQVWGGAPEPRMYHLGTTFTGAFPGYLQTILNVKTDAGADTTKYVDGVMLDTYTGIADTEGYLPNMHHLRELIAAGYGASDQAARQYYVDGANDNLEAARIAVIAATSLTKITFAANYGDQKYVHDLYPWLVTSQLSKVTGSMTGLEYLASSSKTDYWTLKSYLYDRYMQYVEAGTNGAFCFDQIETSHYSPIPPPGINDYVPPEGHQSWIAAVFWLMRHPAAIHGIHWGTPAPPGYGPGLYPNIGESKGGKFSESHWFRLLEFNMGTAAIRTGVDFGGNVDTDRMFVVEDWPTPGYPIPGRIVLRRNFEKDGEPFGFVIARFEKADDTYPFDPNYGRIGEQPIVYDFGETVCEVVPDPDPLSTTGLMFGNLMTSDSLGLGEGGMYVYEAFCEGSTLPVCTDTINNCGGDCPPCEDPVCNYNGITDDGETGPDCGNGVCPDCEGDPVCNYNTIQDDGETGPDCGNGVCPPCPIEPNIGDIEGFFNYLGTTYLIE